MLAERAVSFSVVSEKELRRQIDRSVSRALVDREYARRLLADPTVALETHGCAPQQFKSLRTIRANDLVDFARQARSLFWIVEPTPPSAEDQLALPTAAAL